MLDVQSLNKTFFSGTVGRLRRQALAGHTDAVDCGCGGLVLVDYDVAPGALERINALT